ncbi:hypothetical protein K3G39_09275 [Pontibacter sp. HSC-14F20]|uniref:TrmB family transcriptional regulator sugar-binding domain-containing protein n=1 Tax=Pontibacter sp. HSC-14F20 TaxID=2864136 RepID=UPI001C72E3ED|nr:TrmB family transcriptional regulator sugar-binding domain-containing protein [Pontibacter sp. HSC-14F20]MBX0333428.1 hypothetical protein [Pontibacter sp. HSC-14F20]
MKFIPPLEIASKIMTLIEDANEYLVVVSPYVNLKNWEKMKLRLRRAKERGVRIEFYIRQNADMDLMQFTELGITPIRIQDLHAKLYYNEEYAIVTSQNMIKYSDENSIDIGYVTETKEEIQQLVNFTERNLKTYAPHSSPTEKPIQESAPTNEQHTKPEDFKWDKYLYCTIRDGLDKSVKVYHKGHGVEIKAGGSTFNAFIWNSRVNKFRISSLLTKKEFECIRNSSSGIPLHSDLTFELMEGWYSSSDTIWATSNASFDIQSLKNVNAVEGKLIADMITAFILSVDELKKKCN